MYLCIYILHPLYVHTSICCSRVMLLKDRHSYILILDVLIYAK